ncbi:E3 ubiquitin-protein ligase NRDP1-like [Actinia tenebrosa]|uniref:E3 ubiquitin-protein ligase NRDP1-like n=1 Tax=Actinia tenebrosa TaxID=6105 RepID=A0A6P8I015_ACTTE|nr:E3 ubiquitin-protein ligase NRDP1-like [Actinia tenebrosa]
MGYGLHKFVGKVDPNLICSICVGVLEKAVTTICGHSFCEDCLDKWLDRPQARSCPSCRSHVLKVDLIPVHALRGIVDGLSVHCDNSENGCEMVMKLEKHQVHLESCPYGMVECKACHSEVKRLDLVDHHEECTVLQSLAAKMKGELANDPTTESLYTLIAELKIDLQNTKSKLFESENEVSRVGRQLKRMKLRMQIDDDLEYDPEWDPDYSYGYSPSSIAHLSSIIAKYLLNKPYYVDRNRVFNAVKRCHDYYHSYASYYQDVHMLLATAYASNWFTENQRSNFECWLNNLTRQRFLR